jgi:hypothetical protein
MMLLLSLFYLAFRALTTISLILKEVTFKGLLYFLDTLAAAITIFI